MDCLFSRSSKLIYINKIECIKKPNDLNLLNIRFYKPKEKRNKKNINNNNQMSR